MHSVADVKATFADHGLPLSVLSRTRVSTALLPARYVRALHRTRPLGTPPPAPRYEVVVITSRRFLRNLPRHERDAVRALRGRGIFHLTGVSTRHDNVVIIYPAGTPKNLTRLRRIVEDV